MTLPRTVADVLTDHVVFEVECIDRMYLNVYVPRLQYAAGLVGFVHRQLGLPIASTAPLGKISDAVRGRDAPLRPRPAGAVGGLRQGPAQGRRRCTSTWPGSTGEEGVLFIGRAQEKTAAVPHRETPQRRRAQAYPWIVQSTGVVNQFYFYCRGRRLRPVLPQVLLLLPLQRQAVHQRPRVGQAASRQGRDRVHRAGQRLRRLRRPAALQAICDRLGPTKIDALLRKWLAIAAAPVHRRRPGRRLPLRRARSCRPSSP